MCFTRWILLRIGNYYNYCIYMLHSRIKILIIQLFPQGWTYYLRNTYVNIVIWSSHFSWIPITYYTEYNVFLWWNLMQSLSPQKYKCIILHQRKKILLDQIYVSFIFRGMGVIISVWNRQPSEKSTSWKTYTGEKADLYHNLVLLLLEFKSLPLHVSFFFY